MARPGITYEQVQLAAERLFKQGSSPSIQRIREDLGTGSNTTIATHLRRWQQERHESPVTTLPPSIPEPVVSAFEAFWNIAFEQAGTQFIEYREQADHAIAQANQKRDNAVAELELIREEAGNLKQQLTKERAKARELQKHLLVEEERTLAAETHIAAMKERLTQAQQEVKQLRVDATAQTSRQEEALRQLRSEWERRMAEAEQRLAFERERGEANEARLMVLLDQAKTEHNQDKTQFAQELQAWQEQKASFRTEIASIKTKIAEAQFMTAMTEQANQRLTVQLQHIEAACSIEHDRYLKTARFVDHLRTRLKAANADRRRLERLLTAQNKT